MLVARFHPSTKTLEVDLKETHTDAITRAPKKHPGCLIWWFLPGCILGDRIGVDPFGIYPWEKFCRKYSDLQTHKKCEDILKEQTEKDIIGDEVEEDLSVSNPAVHANENE